MQAFSRDSAVFFGTGGKKGRKSEHLSKTLVQPSPAKRPRTAADDCFTRYKTRLMSEPPEGGGMRIVHNTALGMIVAATLAPLPARAADAPQLPPGISEFMYQLTVPKDLQPTQAEI